jgi:hypothetical protein
MSTDYIKTLLVAPIAAVSGWAATVLTSHHLLPFTQPQTSKAIDQGIVFGVTALVTALAHSRYLANAAKWWQHEEAQAAEARLSK